MTLTIIDLRGRDERLAPRSVAIDAETRTAVRELIARVRAEGDAALLELTKRFDGADLGRGGILAGADEFDAAARVIPQQLKDAIDRLIDRLLALHTRQLPEEWWTEEDGLRYGEVVRPIARVGCYVPGGRASYPSTVAMTVVPAAVAGVPRIIVCSPPQPDGSLPPTVLYAARAAGAHRVAKVGGAHAIAALAYGTSSFGSVDKIVGPGNLYVTAAKREVMGDVGIDALAGPSELAVVAGPEADPRLLAGDLIAQAEHDPLAATTLITPEEGLVKEVDQALALQEPRSARRDVVGEALQHSRAVLVDTEDRAAEVVNDLAPEHVHVVLAEPRSFLPRIRNAGAVFLGSPSAVPFGDYGAGSNHVLPTMGTARFASGLRVTDFLKTSAVVEVDEGAVERLSPDVALLARAEGLDGHARAVEARVGGRSDG